MWHKVIFLCVYIKLYELPHLYTFLFDFSLHLLINAAIHFLFVSEGDWFGLFTLMINQQAKYKTWSHTLVNGLFSL